MTKYIYTFSILLLTSITSTSSADDKKINQAIEWMMQSCVSSGSKIDISAKGNADLKIKSILKSGVGAELSFTKSEITGLTNELNNLSLQNADQVRDCIAPYRGQILNAILGGQGGQGGQIVQSPTKQIESNDIQYKLNWCRKHSNKIVCQVNATSMYRNRLLTVGQKGFRTIVGQSTLHDNIGNIYQASYVKVGNQVAKRKTGVKNFQLIANIPTNILLKFENIATNARTISQLNIGVSVTTDNNKAQETIPFSNIKF